MIKSTKQEASAWQWISVKLEEVKARQRKISTDASMQPKYRVATQSHANRYTHSFCMVSMTAGATVSTLTSRDLSRFDGSDFGPE
ncbi:hypothetical protein K0M31_014531 [Melipona bicolor]|uniref:Uncharacterized protein n=1 Tax=Melipona bicolor TaxID=60889 RepID=A0AA40G8R3_9HYME|nr:hypothetical protein K0M31_014531 [Melipona bicolor]